MMIVKANFTFYLQICIYGVTRIPQSMSTRVMKLNRDRELYAPIVVVDVFVVVAPFERFLVKISNNFYKLLEIILN